MTYQQAVILAIVALAKVRQPFSFNANLHRGGVISESTKLARVEYDKYTDAMEALKQEKML